MSKKAKVIKSKIGFEKMIEKIANSKYIAPRKKGQKDAPKTVIK